MLVNELLCYVTNNMKRSTSEQVVKAIYRFYDIEEIITAKTILYQKYSELGEFPVRKTSINRTELEAHSTDIVDSLIDLDSQGHNVEFLAKDLNRIPKWNPHETDHMSILEKLNKLEGRLHQVESAMTENTVHMLSIDDKMLKTDKRVDDCEKSIVSLATTDNDVGNPTAYAYAVKNKSISVKGQTAPSQSHKNNENTESKGDTIGDGLPKTRRENNPKTSEDDGWKVPREQRLRDF